MIEAGEFPRHSFTTPIHHSIVVPTKKWPGDRRQVIHPALGRFHFPVVSNRCYRAVVGKLPATETLKLANRAAFDQRDRFDARCFHLKDETIGKSTFPGVTMNGADMIRVAFS